MPYKDKLKEKERQERRRKTLEYKEYQKGYQKKWRKSHPEKWKEILEKAEAKPKRKIYRSNWWKTSPKAKAIRRKHNQTEKKKLYDLKWNREHPEKVKAKYQKYYNTDKGIVNYLKKKDKRKFGENKNITPDLINMVNKRDKFCVYCGKELIKSQTEYDHIIPFKPFSKNNIVRSCSKCNQSKSNANVFEWCKFKGYKPNKIVYKLLKEQNKDF